MYPFGGLKLDAVSGSVAFAELAFKGGDGKPRAGSNGTGVAPAASGIARSQFGTRSGKLPCSESLASGP